MNGEIGSLVQDGKQIGGFLNWTIDPILINSVGAENRVYKMQAIKATAERFWMVSCPLQGEITALYYRLTRGKLVLITQARVEVSLNGELDKLINKPLEMTWMS